MDRVIAIRIGEQFDLFNRIGLNGKWVSPGDASLVREIMVSGYTVYVVFCNRDDTPLYISKIMNVRQRLPTDTDFPIDSPFGRFQEFMEFEGLKTINIISLPFFSKIKDEICYKRGHQVLIGPLLTNAIVGYYAGFFDGFVRNTEYFMRAYRDATQAQAQAQATQANTTTFFPVD